MRLACLAPDFATAVRLLENAVVHFQQALNASQQRPSSPHQVKV